MEVNTGLEEGVYTINEDRIFIFGWTISLKSLITRSTFIF